MTSNVLTGTLNLLLTLTTFSVFNW